MMGVIKCIPLLVEIDWIFPKSDGLCPIIDVFGHVLISSYNRQTSLSLTF